MGLLEYDMIKVIRVSTQVLRALRVPQYNAELFRFIKPEIMYTKFRQWIPLATIVLYPKLVERFTRV